MRGQHSVKTWSSAQGAVALSSTEAEFYTKIEAITWAKGVVNTMTELGFNITEAIQLYTDSSAAKSFVRRLGMGKIKDLETRDLWLQREVGLKRVVVYKVDGTRNLVDLMKKYFARWEVEVRLNLMGMSVGRDPTVEKEDKEELE